LFYFFTDRKPKANLLGKPRFGFKVTVCDLKLDKSNGYMAKCIRIQGNLGT